MAISLRPPSNEHWNIESDLILTLMMDTYQRWLEAKGADQDPERESTRSEASPRETPVPEEAPLAIAGGSQAASPMETTRQGERDLETALGVVERIHARRLQIIHDMGSMREVEQVAVHTLMAEFARLQTILCEDLTKSLSALRMELETSSEVLLADILNILNLRPVDPGFSWVILLSYGHKVRETILVPGIEQPGVFNQIVLALSVDQSMEAVLLPGILDGLSRRLGLMPPGVVDPPTSAREGVSRQWVATLREAVMMTEGREANLDQVTPHVVHPGLHQDYEGRVDDIAPTLTSPMLAGIASSVHLTGRPAVPKGPASPKTEEGLQSCGGAPAQPAVPDPSHIGGPVETEGEKPLELEGINLNATIPAYTSEDAAAVIISDDEVPSFPGGWPEAISTPKTEVASGYKRPSEDTSPHSSPPKK